MMSYTQLTQEQRYQIYALLKMDHTQTEIADGIEGHKSTISGELRRNCGLKGYRPDKPINLQWIDVTEPNRIIKDLPSLWQRKDLCEHPQRMADWA
jgi:IS30 family transposase